MFRLKRLFIFTDTGTHNNGIKLVFEDAAMLNEQQVATTILLYLSNRKVREIRLLCAASANYLFDVLKLRRLECAMKKRVSFIP